jgi:uncharacterized membrane protein
MKDGYFKPHFRPSTPQVTFAVVVVIALQMLGIPVVIIPLTVWLNVITALTPVVALVIFAGILIDGHH